MYDVILPTVSTITRLRRGQQRRCRAWIDQMCCRPAARTLNRSHLFELFLPYFVRPWDPADSDSSFVAIWRGSRSFKRQRLLERRRSSRETFDRARSSMSARRKDDDEKELLARVSSRRLGRSRPGGSATSDGRSTDDEWPGDRWRESNAEIVKPSGIKCKATTFEMFFLSCLLIPTIVRTSSSIAWHCRRRPRTTAVSTLRYLAYL